MKRNELSNKTYNELFKILVDKHGLTKTNDQIARESVKMFDKELDIKLKLIIKKEAILRTLCGHEEREEIIPKFDKKWLRMMEKRN